MMFGGTYNDTLLQGEIGDYIMIKPQEVAKYAKQKEKENVRFRSYLKCHAEEEKLDGQFLRLHKELFDGYDCSQCRNCCKAYYGAIPAGDLEKTAAGLNLSKEQLVASFLDRDEASGNYITKHVPCDFLKEDGSCMLGENCPDDCRNYPYTDQPNRLGSLYGMLDAVEVCPVAYEIWERLKQEYRFGDGRKR